MSLVMPLLVFGPPVSLVLGILLVSLRDAILACVLVLFAAFVLFVLVAPVAFAFFTLMLLAETGRQENQE